MVIAIEVSLVDRCTRGIRWGKTMTRVFPRWRLILSLYGGDRREKAGLRHRRGVHEGVAWLQIGNGMTRFFVTASRGGDIVIDIG